MPWSQHPFTHEVSVHWHCPPTHCCPLAHGGPEPQRQLPLTQVSAVKESQAKQAPPPVPHAPAVGEATQLLPTQQPAQLVLQVPQAPLMHVSPFAHGTQALPPVPQAPAEGATH